MNIRNVLLIIIGAVAVSVASTLLTLRFIQKPSENTPTYVGPSASMPQGFVQIAPSQEPIPPPPPQQIPAAKTALSKNPVASIDLSAVTTPKEFESNSDTRMPMKPEEAKRTILKNTPSCGDDYDQFCTKNHFLSEHPMACLRSKKTELSGACLSQLNDVQERFLKTCAADIQKYCPHRKLYFTCLKEKLPELTSDCRANIKETSRR